MNRGTGVGSCATMEDFLADLIVYVIQCTAIEFVYWISLIVLTFILTAQVSHEIHNRIMTQCQCHVVINSLNSLSD